MNNALPVYQMIDRTALRRNHKPTLQNYIRSRQNSHIQQMICSSIDRTSNSSSRTLQARPVLNWTGTENPQSVFTSGLAHSTTPLIVANATPSYVHPWYKDSMIWLSRNWCPIFSNMAGIPPAHDCILQQMRIHWNLIYKSLEQQY